MKFILYGYKGFVGGELYSALVKSKFDVLGIDRNSFIHGLNQDDVDAVIHCANPAKRFTANNNPEDDLNNIREKTRKILQSHYGNNLILISSISCRTELNTAYGRNRKEAEESWLENGGMVFRLGPLYGGNRIKDTLHDLANNLHIYYSPDTLYAYANVAWVSQYIANYISSYGINNKIVEIGARNVISLGRIAEYIDSKSTFSNKIDSQYPFDFSFGPDAYDVLDYALQLKKNLK